MSQATTELHDLPELASTRAARGVVDAAPVADPHPEVTAADCAGATSASPLDVLLQLGKFRLSLLVVWTTAVGAILAGGTVAGPFDAVGFVWTLFGVLLAAASANAFNQVLEMGRDARMRRTRTRPLPAGAVSPAVAALAATAMGAVGCGALAVFVNVPAAALALLTIVLYVGVYTPLKPLTTLNTLVGAIVGAIPPVIGWTSVTGGFEAGAWALAAILFVWQLPHFLALAWMYREDYARGGFRMLPIIDPSGRITAQVTVTTSMMLVPVALVPALLGLAGWFHVAGAIALGAWMTVRALRFQRERSHEAAKRLFLASLVYLTALLVLVVADRTVLSRPFELPTQRASVASSMPTAAAPIDDVVRRLDG